MTQYLENLEAFFGAQAMGDLSLVSGKSLLIINARK